MVNVMTDLFNNREIATGIWLVIVAIFAGRSKAVRESMADLSKMFTNPKIAVPILLMVAYVGLEVVFLKRLSFWDTSLLKDTLYWFILSGFALLMNIIGEKEPGKFFKETVLQCVGITVALEFLLNLYTLPLLGEFFLLPVLFLIAAASVMAENDPKYAPVGKLSSGIQSVLGVLLFVYVGWSLYVNHAELTSRTTLDSFLLPILLTLLFLPFLYFTKLVAVYELFFVRLQIFIREDNKLRAYVRRKALLQCHFDLFKLARFQKIALASNWELNDRRGVDRLVERFKSGQTNVS